MKWSSFRLSALALLTVVLIQNPTLASGNRESGAQGNESKPKEEFVLTSVVDYRDYVNQFGGRAVVEILRVAQQKIEAIDFVQMPISEGWPMQKINQLKLENKISAALTLGLSSFLTGESPVFGALKVKAMLNLPWPNDVEVVIIQNRQLVPIFVVTNLDIEGVKIMSSALDIGINVALTRSLISLLMRSRLDDLSMKILLGGSEEALGATEKDNLPEVVQNSQLPALRYATHFLAYHADSNNLYFLGDVALKLIEEENGEVTLDRLHLALFQFKLRCIRMEASSLAEAEKQFLNFLLEVDSFEKAEGEVPYLLDLVSESAAIIKRSRKLEEWQRQVDSFLGPQSVPWVPREQKRLPKKRSAPLRNADPA